MRYTLATLPLRLGATRPRRKRQWNGSESDPAEGIGSDKAAKKATRPRTKAAVEWLGKRPCRWERQGRADESGRFAPSGLVADESGRFAPSGLVADAKKNNL